MAVSRGLFYFFNSLWATGCLLLYEVFRFLGSRVVF